MKSFFSIALFFISAFAQRALIGLPTEEQQINSGKDVVIQVQRPVSWSMALATVIAIPFD